MQSLTKKQSAAMDAVKSLHKTLHRIPTGTELGKVIGRNRSQCGRLIETLEDKGHIVWDAWRINKIPK